MRYRYACGFLAAVAGTCLAVSVRADCSGECAETWSVCLGRPLACDASWQVGLSASFYSTVTQQSNCDASLIWSNCAAAVLGLASDSMITSCDNRHGGVLCLDSDSKTGTALTTPQFVSSAWAGAGPFGCLYPVSGAHSASVTGPFTGNHTHTDGFSNGQKDLYDTGPTLVGTYRTSSMTTGFAVSSRSVDVPNGCDTLAIAGGVIINDTFNYGDTCSNPPINLAYTFTNVRSIRMSGTVTPTGGSPTPVQTIAGLLAIKPDGTVIKLGLMNSSQISVTQGQNGGFAVGGEVSANVQVASAQQLPFTFDQTMESDSFTFNGDIDRDGDVDWNDRRALIAAIGSSLGDANFNARADFDLDGAITYTDYTTYVPLFNTWACEADFNADGIMSVDDQILYFNAYFVGTLEGDFGGNLYVGVDDLFMYNNAYFVGCP